jgi:hypothetical protein
LKKDDTCTDLACRDTLEKILRDPVAVTDEMDAQDFLLYLGITYMCPRYRASTRLDLRVEARQRYHRRRGQMKGRSETRIANYVMQGYPEQYRTIGEMRDALETGVPRYVGAKTFERLNEILVGFGLRAVGPRKDGRKNYWEYGQRSSMTQ